MLVYALLCGLVLVAVRAETPHELYAKTGRVEQTRCAILLMDLMFKHHSALAHVANVAETTGVHRVQIAVGPWSGETGTRVIASPIWGNIPIRGASTCSDDSEIVYRCSMLEQAGVNWDEWEHIGYSEVGATYDFTYADVDALTAHVRHVHLNDDDGYTVNMQLVDNYKFDLSIEWSAMARGDDVICVDCGPIAEVCPGTTAACVRARHAACAERTLWLEQRAARRREECKQLQRPLQTQCAMLLLDMYFADENGLLPFIAHQAERGRAFVQLHVIWEYVLGRHFDEADAVYRRCEAKRSRGVRSCGWLCRLLSGDVPEPISCVPHVGYATDFYASRCWPGGHDVANTKPWECGHHYERGYVDSFWHADMDAVTAYIRIRHLGGDEGYTMGVRRMGGGYNTNAGSFFIGVGWE